MSPRPFPCALLALAIVGLSSIAATGAEPEAAAPKSTLPEHRVVAMYFHRTERCATCQKISALIEEAIQNGFADELRGREVSLHMIDFQDTKNAKFTKAYKITTPTLVLANVRDETVVEWKAMPKVWSLVGQKPEFLTYVRSAVRDYLEK